MLEIFMCGESAIKLICFQYKFIVKISLIASHEAFLKGLVWD